MRPLHEIAEDIRSANMDSPGNGWYWCAQPYVEAMHQLSTVSDRYGMDDGRGIVTYALSNLRGWRGETARQVKAELKKHLG